MKVIRHEDRLWVSVEDHHKAVEFARQAATIVEREECAKVCEDIDKEYDGEDVSATWCASHIRARGLS